MLHRTTAGEHYTRLTWPTLGNCVYMALEKLQLWPWSD